MVKQHLQNRVHHILSTKNLNHGVTTKHHKHRNMFAQLWFGFSLGYKSIPFLLFHPSVWLWVIAPLLVNIIVFSYFANSVSVPQNPTISANTTETIAALANITTVDTIINNSTVVTHTLSTIISNYFYSLCSIIYYIFASILYYLWVIPIKTITWLIGSIIIITFFSLLYISFILLADGISSPFLNKLSLEIEHVIDYSLEHNTSNNDSITNKIVNAKKKIGISDDNNNNKNSDEEEEDEEEEEELFEDNNEFINYYKNRKELSTSKILIEEAKRMSVFIVIQLSLVLLNIIPFLSPITTALMTYFTVGIYLPYCYVAYCFDRRGFLWNEKWKYLNHYRYYIIGFGFLCSFTFFIPLLNFVCSPILVVAGTLLFRKLELLEFNRQL